MVVNLRNVNVLFFVRPTLWRIRGGDTVQIEQTAVALRSLGHHVLILSNGPQAREILLTGKADVLHVWNLGRPQDALAVLPAPPHIRVYLSTLWVDYSAYDQNRTGLFGLLSSGMRDYVKMAVKGLTGMDRFPPWSAWSQSQESAQRSVLHHVDAVFTTTQHESERIRSAFPGLFGSTRTLHTLPPGVWPTLINEKYQSHLDADRPGTRKGWLCIGRIEGLKNQAALAEAWEMLAKRKEDPGPLLFLGEIAPNHHRYRNRFVAAVKAARAAGADVHWLPGPFDAMELAQKYRFAEGVIVPSLFETYGLTALEGLATGCKVVLTLRAESIGDLKQRVTWAHPSPEGLAAAVVKAHLHSSSSLEGRAWACEHTWQRAAQRLDDHYKIRHRRFSLALLGSRGIPNRYGGFEELAEHLALGLQKKGHRVAVYTSSEHPDKSAYWHGIERPRFWDPARMLGSFSQFLYDTLSLVHACRQNYSTLLLLGTTSSGLALNVFRTLRLLRTPLLAVHMDGLEWKREKYSRWVQEFLRWQEHWAAQVADVLISDNAAITSYLKETYPKIPVVEIAYGAVQWPTLPPEQSDPVLTSYGLVSQSYALILGRAVPENHWHTLLDGLSCHPVVAISHWSTPFGEEIRKKYKEQQNIVWIDSLYDRQATEILRQNCRLYFHGHSAGGTNPSLLQAMASGCRIAAHDNRFNRAVLADNAVYFSTAEEVSMAWDASSRCPTDHRESLQAHYRWESIIDLYEKEILHRLAV